MNGVIWSKTQKTFVPISSVPVYAMLRQERLRRIREYEDHNFQLANITLTSFEEPNFFEFYDNNRRVTGFCGELWTILSESLNFTLQLVKSNESSLGEPDEHFYYGHGILGMIFRNETMAIPKLETFSQRLVNCDFTIPLWMSSQRTYIKLESIHDSTWMVQVFSWQIWCAILIVHVLLTVCGFWSQIILAQFRDKWKKTTIDYHAFYNFALLCNQNYIPEILEGRSKILETSLSFFCYLMYVAFGALLFIYMSKRVFIPPFDNLITLVVNTKYKVLVLNGSIADITFQVVGRDGTYLVAKYANRVIKISTPEEMYQMACSQKKGKYVILESIEEYITRGKMICQLTAIGETYLDMWVASGIIRNFKYKRTIDLKILKLMEVGLLDVLKTRWLTEKTKPDDFQPTEAITMDQVTLIVAVVYYGVIIAFTILIIEKIVYTYKLKGNVHDAL